MRGLTRGSATLRLASLATVLFVFWLILSGHYTALLIVLGIVTVAGTVMLARRMRIVDTEGHPIELAPRAPAYWGWLSVEIAKSAWTVSRIILDPKLPVTPTLVRLKASQKTDLGVNVYANSITLTPGTITLEAVNGELLVHAVTREGAEDLREGAMDRRVTRFEGLS